MDFMTGFTQSPTVGVRVWTRNRKFLGVVVVLVKMMLGTGLVHVCEGAVRYPVEWS